MWLMYIGDLQREVSMPCWLLVPREVLMPSWLLLVTPGGMTEIFRASYSLIF